MRKLAKKNKNAAKIIYQISVYPIDYFFYSFSILFISLINPVIYESYNILLFILFASIVQVFVRKKLYLKPYDFRFEEIDNPRKADPYTVFKLAMDEFQVFDPLKEILEDAKKRLDDYAKKMKLKGKIVFPKNDFSRPKIEKEINLQIGTNIQNIQNNPRNKSVGFIHRFMPDEIEWKFALVFDDKYVTGISGEIGLGKYFEVEGKFAKEKDIEVKFGFPF